MGRYFNPSHVYLESERPIFNKAIVAAQTLNDYLDFERSAQYSGFSVIDQLFCRVAYILAQQLNTPEDRGSVQLCIALNRILDKSKDADWVDGPVVGAYRDVLLAISRFIMLVKEFDRLQNENPTMAKAFFQERVTNALQLIFLTLRSSEDAMVWTTSFQALGSCAIELLRTRAEYFPNIQYIYDDNVLIIESISDSTSARIMRYDLHAKFAELFS